MLNVVFNVLTCLAILFGLFFMTVGALGVVRFPDVYARSHAASKCVTLGIAGLILAVVISLGTGARGVAESRLAPGEGVGVRLVDADPGEPTVTELTKLLLVFAFVFVATPVGSHMLARAAHVARVPTWSGTLSDDLAADRAKSSDEQPDPPPADGTGLPP